MKSNHGRRLTEATVGSEKLKESGTAYVEKYESRCENKFEIRLRRQESYG